MTDPFKTFTRTQWESIAAEETADLDVTIFPVTAQAAERLLDAANVRSGSRVLDVACGPGQWLDNAKARGARVVGLDIARGMVDIARRRHRDVEFVVGDAEDLPFATASFDAVICNFGMPQFASPRSAVDESLRVLRSGGSYAFTFLSPERGEFFQIVRTTVEQHGDLDVPLPKGPPSRWTDDASRALLADAGFVDVSIASMPLVVTTSDPRVALTVLYTTGRNRALVMAQAPERRRRIEEAIIAAAQGHAADDAIVLGIPSLLAHARKP